MHDKKGGTKEKKSNKNIETGNSSPDERARQSINDPDPVKDNLKYSTNDMLTSKEIERSTFPQNLIEYQSEIEEQNNIFESQTSSYNTHQNKNYISNHFTIESEALEKLNSESIVVNTVIEFTNANGEENKLLLESQNSSDLANQNIENASGQLTTETSKNISGNKTNLNNVSKERIFPNAEIEFPSGNTEENKLFESQNISDFINQNKENSSCQLITESETSKITSDKLMKLDLLNINSLFPDLSEFPSDNTIFPNTSQYTSHNSTTISIENLTSDSEDSYENIKKNWSLDSSKVLMTPSKQTVNSTRDIMKVHKNPNAADFIQILDAIEGNLNDIINENQLPEQTTLKLQNEEDNNSREDQKTTMLLHGIVNDNQSSDNPNVKFIITKKSRENQDTILDSSEEIEKNIFARNNIAPNLGKSISGISDSEKELSIDENEIDNLTASKIYKLADILHDQLSKNYGKINFETRVQLPNISQEQNIQIFDKENLVYWNNVNEDKTVEDLLNNESVKAQVRGPYETEMPFRNGEDEKYLDSLSECKNSPVTSMDKPSYYEQMLKQGLEHTSQGMFSKTSTNCFEKNKTNDPSSSKDSNNHFPIKSKEPKDAEDEYHLISKSSHNINNFDKELSETIQRTDEIINKIIAANTQEELLQIMKPKHSKMESIEENDTQEVLITKGSEYYISIDKKEPKYLKNELPFNSAPESYHIPQDVIHTERSVKDKINKKFTTSNTTLGNSNNNLEFITTPSSSIKDENFRIISEEKEKSSLIMSLKTNKMQTILKHSVPKKNSSDENSTTTEDENIKNTTLYFANQITDSPYTSPTCNHNMVVNMNNEKQKNIQGKLMNCFRKFNFWTKRKSKISLRSNESESNNKSKN